MPSACIANRLTGPPLACVPNVMAAVQSIVLFVLERIRCAMLALAAIIVLKVVVFSYIAPMTSQPAQSPTAEAHIPVYAGR
ncbi:MAG: hypothetical protein ABW199_05390 [Caulobacterales bacterium]